jgi:hypothetical protein
VLPGRHYSTSLKFSHAKHNLGGAVFAWQHCSHILLGLRPMVLRPTLSSGLPFSGLILFLMVMGDCVILFNIPANFVMLFRSIAK